MYAKKIIFCIEKKSYEKSSYSIYLLIKGRKWCYNGIIDEKEYINIIKQIGEHYPWYDREEKLTDNMEKKQMTLFSLLIKTM